MTKYEGAGKRTWGGGRFNSAKDGTRPENSHETILGRRGSLDTVSEAQMFEVQLFVYVHKRKLEYGLQLLYNM